MSLSLEKLLVSKERDIKNEKYFSRLIHTKKELEEYFSSIQKSKKVSP